ncbi:hypothetical protein BH09MYX1_BH09MYX1_05310 [soil metagenome]
MNDLALALLELPARFGKVDETLDEIDALVARAPCELVVLPEASITGYVSTRGNFDLRPLAEPRGGATERALSAIARRHRVHLAAPLIERDGDAFYNSFFVFDPEGMVIASYQKRHPWYPETWATAGAKPPPVFTVAEWNVTLAICFDVHTLAEDAASELERADLLLFPSAWVEDEGDDLRESLLPPIAARFAVAIANANWAPGDVVLPGQGTSRIYDASGALIAKATERRLDVTLRRAASR